MNVPACKGLAHGRAADADVCFLAAYARASANIERQNREGGNQEAMRRRKLSASSCRDLRINVPRYNRAIVPYFVPNVSAKVPLPPASPRFVKFYKPPRFTLPSDEQGD